jgi:hypothetical protein
MKYKTRELSGAMLDAAVAMAEGENPAQVRSLQYSKSWSDAGKIIERERIGTTWPEESPPAGYEWHANLARPEASFNAYGPTPLIAAMRAYVVSKLGDEVDI